MEPIETIEYKGFNILVFPDDDLFESPREWDNLGTMVCCHSRYSLGDKQAKSGAEAVYNTLLEFGYDQEKLEDQYAENREFVDWGMAEIEERAVVLPLYLYDHSGITMSTKPFSCPWDSGQVGFIYISHEDIRKEYGKLWRKKATRLLISEVEIYDQYLTGEVYGFTIEPLEDTEIECNDSCWGFYGYDYAMKEMVAEAKSSIDYAIEQHQKMEAEITQLMTECWAY